MGNLKARHTWGWTGIGMTGIGLGIHGDRYA